MKVAYRLNRVCGAVYSHGNLAFTPDGNTLLSCVGNRVSLFDLVHHTVSTLPIENNYNIHTQAISHNGIFLITVDVTGHALIINIQRKLVLLKFNFKRKVHAITFSQDDRFFIVSYGNGAQIWKTPSVGIEFAPLSLIRNLTGFSDEVTCLDWCHDNQLLILGSKDLTARIYYRVLSKKMSLTVLSGHRDALIGGKDPPPIAASPPLSPNLMVVTLIAYLASDDVTAYTIAKDGAIFTWIFEKHSSNSSSPFRLFETHRNGM